MMFVRVCDCNVTVLSQNFRYTVTSATVTFWLIECNWNVLINSPEFSQFLRRRATLKADSHIACCAHAVPLPCLVAKGLECVFPIWFTHCGRVWFTLAMPCHAHAASMPCSDHAVLLKVAAQHARRETACGLPARFRFLPATTRSSTKIVIRSIPIPSQRSIPTIVKSGSSRLQKKTIS